MGRTLINLAFVAVCLALLVRGILILTLSDDTKYIPEVQHVPVTVIKEVYVWRTIPEFPQLAPAKPEIPDAGPDLPDANLPAHVNLQPLVTIAGIVWFQDYKKSTVAIRFPARVFSGDEPVVSDFKIGDVVKEDWVIGRIDPHSVLIYHIPSEQTETMWIDDQIPDAGIIVDSGFIQHLYPLSLSKMMHLHLPL